MPLRPLLLRALCVARVGLALQRSAPRAASATARPRVLAASARAPDRAEPRLEGDGMAALKRAANIVDVMARYKVELRHTGGYAEQYTCLCPFHDDKNPSMSVNAEQGLYNCFACGAAGNVIQFVEQIEGVTYEEAAITLAEHYGVPLAARGGAAGVADVRSDLARRRRLHGALNASAAFFSDALVKDPLAGRARAYLRQRQIEPALAARFGLGVSPAPRRSVLAHLRSMAPAPDDDLLVDAGLAARSATGTHERFGGRLMIPIRDQRGATIAFGARTLVDEGAAPGGQHVAKYLNSPETPLFSKSRVVFGLDVAAPHLRAARCAVVVEGYFDVIALHGAGVRTAVGTLGTAVTREQLELVARQCGGKSPQVVLALDGDDAGERAAERLCEDGRLARLAAVDVRVASMRESGTGAKDAAEFLEHHGTGADYERLVVGRALPWIEWYAQRVVAACEQAGDRGIEQVAFDEACERFARVLAAFPGLAARTLHGAYFAGLLSNATATTESAREKLREALERDLVERSQAPRGAR